MEFQNIILEKKEDIAGLTINRPLVNVMNYETLLETNVALEELAKDEDLGNGGWSGGTKIVPGEKAPYLEGQVTDQSATGRLNCL